MADPVRDEAAPVVKPSEIRRKTFNTSRRGYDQSEVEQYLRSVAETLRDAQKREAEMRSRLGKAVRKADEASKRVDEATRRAEDAIAKARASRGTAAEPTDEQLTARLGDEVAQVLESARAAAEERTHRSVADAERIATEAKSKAELLLRESKSVLDIRTQEAASAATRIIDAADEASAELTAEAEATVQRAQQTGLDHLRQAQIEGEGIVEQAEAARRQILKDMDRRRRSMRAQVEQLRAARDRLLESHDVVQTTLDEAKQELKHSLIEAKVKGENAARAAGEARYLNHEELETEIADSVLVGRVELPEIDFRDEVSYKRVLGASPDQIESAAQAKAAKAPAKKAPAPEPEATKPEAKKPEAKKPEAKKQEPAKPEAKKQDAKAPKAAKPAAKAEKAAKSAPQKPETKKASPQKTPAPSDAIDKAPQWAEDVDVADLAEDPFVEPADLGGKGAANEPAAEITGLADEIIAQLDEPATKAEAPAHPSSGPKLRLVTTDAKDTAKPKPAAKAKKPAAKDAAKKQAAASKDAAVADELPAERVEIDDLFARIRQRDEAAEAAKAAPSAGVRKFPEPEEEPEDWELDDEELPAAASADSLDLAATRDEAICDVEVEVTRRLKRVLVDEQNVLLEAAERSYAGPLVDVLPELDQHVEIYLNAVTSQLENAIAAGSMFVDPSAKTPKLLKRHFEPAVRNLIVEPIRERLGEVVPNDDVDAAMNVVRGFYREHKRDQLTSAGVFMVLHAFARGTAGTIDQSVGVRWVFVEADRGCPDGHDNELAGPMAVGEVFPSGAQMPPIAPGCRCLLVPADR